MGKFTDRLKSIGLGVVRSFRDFPVEALLGLVFFILFILIDTGVQIGGKEIGGVPFLYFVPLLILTFCLHRFARVTGKKVWMVLYIVSGLLWIPLWLLVPDEPSSSVTWVIYLLSFILLFAGCARQDNETYARTILHTFLKAALAILVGAILSGLISGIIASVSFLFLGGDIPEGWYTYPNMLIWLILAPLLCCLFISEDLMDLKGRRVLTVVIDYLLSPALLIYTVILYLYIIRILIRWELPEGGVAYMVGAYVGVALSCCLLQELVEKRHFDWFYRFFPYIAIAPILLLWIGVFRRIGEYGLTEARCYLIAVSILLTAFPVMLMFPKTRSFRMMSFIFGAVAALLTFIPGIQARNFGIRSQRARLERALPEILVDGHLPENAPYGAIARSPELEKTWTMASGAWDYLSGEMDRDAFEERFGQYGTMDFKAWRLSEVKEELEKEGDTGIPAEEVGEMEPHELRNSVNLGPYSVLVSDADYTYYEDAHVVVFYSFISPETELLRCEIADRLSASRSGSVTEPGDSALLVYHNDRYLAIFERITDYGSIPDCSTSFTTGRKMLFRKP